jgi:hypothetical protein
MPPKKPVEPRSKAAQSDLLLQYGPRNNIISWRDRIEKECVELYGMTGTFLSTNRPYHIPYPVERDFHPFPEMLSDWESDSDNDGANAVAPATSPVGDGDDKAEPRTAGPPVLEVDKATKALIAKMRDNAFEARRKKIELQELNLTKLWPYVTNQMTSASLAEVREFPEFEEAKASRDVIALWGFVRKSHLTHVFGSNDNMRAVNIHDQLIRFGNMRQGDHEYISNFKTRHNNQVKTNEGVGIVNENESLVAVDFSSKIDQKRITNKHVNSLA